MSNKGIEALIFMMTAMITFAAAFVVAETDNTVVAVFAGITMVVGVAAIILFAFIKGTP